MKPRVLITDYDFPDIALERELYHEAGVELITAQCKSEADVIEAARDIPALLIQYAPLNSAVFAARPEIGIVSRYGAGFDTINTVDAQQHGVWVANSPDYGVGEVATHALAMALALVRRLPMYDRDIRAGRWHYESAGKVRRARDLTLGILGLGRIGKRMALISREVFGRVIACDPYVIDGDFPPYVQRASLEQLFSEADVISLHTPLNDETRGIANARLFALMKAGSVLVNTARGAVVNVDDLVAALGRDQLDGAALDVLPVEPVPPDHALLKHPRVILSPHSAFYSTQAEIDLRRKAAQNVVDWYRMGRPTYPVVVGRKQPPVRLA